MPLRVVCVCATVLSVMPVAAHFAQSLPVELFANVGMFQEEPMTAAAAPGRSVSAAG